LQNEQTLKVDGQFRRRDAVEKSYPRSKKTIYGGRALFAEGVISSDVAMAEQGAARRQRAPEVERREAQRPGASRRSIPSHCEGRKKGNCAPRAAKNRGEDAWLFDK
jgi:hypothetical protein